MPTSVVFNILFLIVLAILAAYSLIRGWRGCRTGEDKRCRKCGYILYGIACAQCPECGLPISPGNTVMTCTPRRSGVRSAE